MNYLEYFSSDRDFLAEVDVLDRMEDLNPFLHGLLEGFAARNETDPAGPFVNHSGRDGVVKVVFSGSSSGVDEADPPHIAVDDLIASQVDRVVCAKRSIHFVA